MLRQGSLAPFQTLRPNPAHPLFKGLTSAWTPGQLWSRIPRPANGGTPVTGPFGLGASFNGTSDSVALGSRALVHASGTSRFALVRVGAAAANRAISSGGASSLNFRAASATLELLVAGVGSIASSSSAVSANEYCSLGFSFLSGDSALYKNGTRIATSSVTATPTDNGTDFLGQSGSSSQDWDGHIYLHLSWNRVLTAAEMRMLDDDPWGIFRPSFVPVKSPAASSGAYTLTCASGTYTLSGQAVTLKVSRTMSAAQGSYTLSGQAVALKVGRTMAVGQGSYALTGQTVGLSVARQMAANQGTYTLNGQDVTLSKSGGDKTLTVGQGTYTLSGQPVTLSATRRMTVDQGSYSLTGQAVTLSLGGRVLQAATGIYLLSGQEVMLTYSGQPPMAYDIVTARRRFRR